MLLKNHFSKLIAGCFLVVGFAACTERTDLRACSESGYFSDQSSCQGGSASNNCVMTTVPSSTGTNTVCWKTSASTTGGTSDTGTASGARDTPWQVGEWSACTSSTTTQTRTVTCKPGYNCSSSVMPATSQPCPTMLNGGSHSTTDCQQISGSMVNLSSKNLCSVAGASCPQGWSSFKNSNNISFTGTEEVVDNGFGVYPGPVSCAYFPISSGWHSPFYAVRDLKTICSFVEIYNTGCTCRTWKVIESKVTRSLCY